MKLVPSDLMRLLRRCGSANERAFAWALVRLSTPEIAPPIEFADNMAMLRLVLGDVVLWLTVQHETPDGDGRHDFRLVGSALNMVIEIDDASHWTNAAKAQDDRRRDRENLAQGVVTVRFTNLEIEQHADRCAREVLEMIEALCGLCAPRAGMGVPWESLIADGCENPGEHDDIHEAFS